MPLLSADSYKAGAFIVASSIDSRRARCARAASSSPSLFIASHLHALCGSRTKAVQVLRCESLQSMQSNAWAPGNVMSPLEDSDAIESDVGMSDTRYWPSTASPSQKRRAAEFVPALCTQILQRCLNSPIGDKWMLDAAQAVAGRVHPPCREGVSARKKQCYSSCARVAAGLRKCVRERRRLATSGGRRPQVRRCKPFRRPATRTRRCRDDHAFATARILLRDVYVARASATLRDAWC